MKHFDPVLIRLDKILALLQPGSFVRNEGYKQGLDDAIKECEEMVDSADGSGQRDLEYDNFTLRYAIKAIEKLKEEGCR